MPKAPKSQYRRPRGASIEVAETMGSGAAKIKKKIRDIERLLKKNDKLPADKRVEYDRALKALKVELQNTQVQLKAKEIGKKYHMVRFFEKKKAIRKLKQLRKQFEEVNQTGIRKDIKKIRKQLRHGEVDLAYVILFPKTEKYISLYPNAKENDEVDMSNPKAKLGARKTEERRKQIRKEVEKLMEDGKLPFSIDEAITGKAITLYTETVGQSTSISQEIDAPEVKKEGEEEEEDEFFE